MSSRLVDCYGIVARPLTLTIFFRLEELSKERTKELQVIELERKALLQREKEMDDMVQNLQTNLNAQTDRMNSRMER